MLRLYTPGRILFGHGTFERALGDCDLIVVSPSIKTKIMQRIEKDAEIIKFKRKESEKEKLKRLSLENLERVKKLEDKKKLVIAAAAVLNDFLEVKLGIPRELTHNELANELEKREMKDELLKNQLIDFFRRLAVEEYTDRLDMEDPDEVVNLAEMAINELSKT